MTQPNSSHTNELKELNLAFLILAQKMLNEDRETAIFRLGIDETLADVIMGMSTLEIAALANQSHSLIQLRLQSGSELKTIIQNQRSAGMKSTHLAMHVMSLQ